MQSQLEALHTAIVMLTQLMMQYVEQEHHSLHLKQLAILWLTNVNLQTFATIPAHQQERVIRHSLGLLHVAGVHPASSDVEGSAMLTGLVEQIPETTLCRRLLQHPKQFHEHTRTHPLEFL